MANIRTELWGHQRKIADFLEQRRYGLIAAEMGTGKTLATLDYVDRRNAKLVLVVCPKLATDVWEDQVYQHTNSASVINLTHMYGNVKLRAAMLEEQLKIDYKTQVMYVLINYDIVWRKEIFDVLYRWKWDVIIADESHRIKSHNSKVSKGMFKLARRHKNNAYFVCLTGTPMPNGREDIFGQARFLNEEIFGQYYTPFLDRYTARVPIQGVIGAYRIIGYRNKEEFQQKLDDFVLYVTMEDTKISLPEKQHIKVPVRLGPSSQKAYDEMKKDMITAVDDEIITAGNALVKGLRLQQLTGGVLKYSEKQEALQGLLEDFPEDEPVVVFAKFHDDLDRIGITCDKVGISWSELSGRKSELAEWKNGDTQALVVQIDAGAESIDLTRARYVIFYSNTWNSATYEQALARVYRPGQERHVYYYHLLATGTIDTRIFLALKDKRDTAMEVLRELGL